MELGAFGVKIQVDSTEAEKSLKGFGKNLKTFLGAAAIGAGVKKITDSLKSMAKETAAHGDEVAKTAQKMNISSDAYQKWDFVLQRNGTSISALSKGLMNLDKAITKESGAFDSLGVSLKNTDGSMKSTEDVMNESIMKLADMEDQTERNALASQLFGAKVAKELQPALNAGSAELQKQMEYAEKYGMVMSEDALKACEDFEDAQLNLSSSMDGVKNTIMAGLLPSINAVMGKITDFFGREDVQEKIKEITAVVVELAVAFSNILIKAITYVYKH